MIVSAGSRLYRLLHADSTMAEFCATLPSLIWAIVLVLPADTFGSSDSYGRMAWAPEMAWAAAFALHGIGGIWAWWTDRPLARRLMMMAGVFVWTAVLAMVVSATPNTTGWVYLVPALSAALGWIQIEARRNDR